MRARILAPLVVFGSALLVYLLTMPPGLTWAHDSADGGDLIAAVVTGGIPHPSGYPTYVLLASPLARLPWHSPAWRVTLLSALAGAAAAAFVAATVQELLRSGDRATLPAMVAGLALAFSTVFWGQSTVAEVYALHGCLAAVLLWLVVGSRHSEKIVWPAAAGLVLGLALGNHLTSLWLAPLLLAAGWRRPGRGHAVAAGLGGLALGLSVYVVLPLRAAGGSPVNWGNAATWQGFWWLVSGRLYSGFAFAAPLAAAPGRLAAAAGLMLRSFLPWGVALAIAGMLRWPRTERLVNLAMLASAGLGLVWSLGYNTSDSYLSWLPAWPFAAVWLGVGLAALLDWLPARDRRTHIIAGLLAALLIVPPLALNWRSNNLSRDNDAEQFVSGVLQDIEPNALVITAGDRATFGLWYGRYAAEQRTDVLPVSRDLWPLASYRARVAAVQPELAGDELAALAASSLAATLPVYAVQAGPEPFDPPAAPAGMTWTTLPALSDQAGRPRWRLVQLVSNNN